MAREMRFGEEAGRDIIRTVREHVRRMQNQPGTRARNRGYQQIAAPCANYYTVRTSFGAVTGSFTWALILESDRSTLASGTFTLGTTTVQDLEDDLSGVTLGPEVCKVYGGTLPLNAMTVHPNRGLGSTRWSFQITSQTVSPPGGSTLPAFVTSDPCCVAGG